MQKFQEENYIKKLMNSINIMSYYYYNTFLIKYKLLKTKIIKLNQYLKFLIFI